MSQKQGYINIGWIIFLLVVVAIGSMGWYALRPQSTALANSVNDQQITLDQKVPSNDLTPLVVNAMPQLQTVNGVTVELVSAKRIETGIEIGVCYPTPDGGDWYPTAGILSYATYQVSPDEFEFISEQKADGINTGKRCALIRYRIDEMENITTPMQFILIDYWAVPRELPPCENLQQRLNTNPKAKAYGLKINCSYTDQTGMSVSLIEKASSVPQNQAQQVLDELIKGEVKGPWEFTITEIKE